MNLKLTKSAAAYEFLLAAMLVAIVFAAASTALWLLYIIEALIFLGAMMIVHRAGSDALFEHLDGMGPVSWSLSFIPYLFAAFAGIFLNR